jgi:hypothetical protein
MLITTHEITLIILWVVVQYGLKDLTGGSPQAMHFDDGAHVAMKMWHLTDLCIHRIYEMAGLNSILMFSKHTLSFRHHRLFSL